MADQDEAGKLKRVAAHASALLSRLSLAGGSGAGVTYGGARDVYQECGWPNAVAPQEYVTRYKRGGIAARLVDAYPDACWREPPEIDTGSEALKAAIDVLVRKHRFWRLLHRADRLTGLGHYGIIVIGRSGGEQLHQPADTTLTSPRLLYLQPHSESNAPVSTWVADTASPRFGQPEIYSVTTGDVENGIGTGGGSRTLAVHHSRVVHISERALEHSAIGTPRLERVWNHLLDLEKITGATAEALWRLAVPLLNWSAPAGSAWSPDDAAQMQAQIDELQHGLRRQIRTIGVTAQTIGGAPADGASQADMLLSLIAGACGIPKRILLGTEAGELASTQDENNWSGRVAERREQFVGPAIVRPTIERMQALGVLPPGDFEIVWSADDTLGEAQRAQIGKTKMAALAAYLSVPGAEQVVSPEEFREQILGLDGPLPAIFEDEPLDGGDDVPIL